jgi:hypothetical protein
MQARAVEKVIEALKAARVGVACYLPDWLFKPRYSALDRESNIRTLRPHVISFPFQVTTDAVVRAFRGARQ